MIITVFKYYSRLDSNNEILDNYFDKLDFVERFNFTKILLNAIPNYINEYNKEDDLTIMKTGSVDLDFSMISGETSSAGHSPYDFFYGDDIADSRFLAIIKFSNGNSFTGMLDIGSIKIDEAITGDKYIISLSCYGIEKELFDKFKKTYFRCYVLEGMSFQNFIYTNVFSQFPQYIPSRLLNLVNPNFLEDKCGFTLNFNRAAIPVLFPTGALYNVDTFLRSFLPTFFCHMRCNLNNENNLDGQFPSFDLSFHFRSDVHNYFSHYKIISEIETFSPNTNKFVFVKAFQYKASTNWYSGIFINPINSQTYNLSMDAGRFDMGDDVCSVSIFQSGHWYVSHIKTEDITIIDLKSYFYFPNDDGIGAAGNAAFVYAWQNVEQILAATAGIEYRRLIDGGVKTATLDISFSNADDMKLFNRVFYKSRTYTIERIKEINQYEQTCKLDIATS